MMNFCRKQVLMGASAWSHFGPYDADLARCFAMLCDNVFATGDYWQRWKPWQEIRQDIEAAVDAQIAFAGLKESLALTQRVAGARMAIRSRADAIEFDLSLQTFLPAPPATIEELIRYNAESGTHSIIDYAHENYQLLPSAEAARYLEPFSPTFLMEVFGTAQPSRWQIETQEDLLWEGVPGGPTRSGTYCVVYEDGQPSEIYVMGISGD
jgi:hypothetical protein